MVAVESERLYLRRFTRDDIPALHTILSDPITMRSWPAPFNPDATLAWIERNIVNYAQRGFGRWAVIERASETLIGDCGIVLLEVAGVIEHDLGYIIHHRYWNQGYATEIGGAAKEYAISELGIRRLVANMPTDNHASRRVAEKIGMRWERTFNNRRNRDLPTYLYAFVLDGSPDAGQAVSPSPSPCEPL